MNIVVLEGRLGQDPKLFPVGDGKKVVFNIAVNRNYKKNDGEWGKETTWVPCEAWDTGAEYIHEKFRKGDPILIQGAMKNDNWETEEGEKRSKLFVRVSSFRRLKFDNPTEEGSEGSEATPVAVGAVDGKDIPF